MQKSGKILVANWKMNPQTVGEAKDIFAPLKKTVVKFDNVNVIVCAPFVFINTLRRMDLAGRIPLGGQDVYFEEYGAFTGEISPTMLKSVGASYVIVGHSERRSLGETDALIALKAGAALKAELRTVLCVGEKERDTHGNYLAVLEDQIKASLQGVQKRFLSNLIVAYEPIWAIGKSAKDAMSPSNIRETAIFIRKILAKLHDSETAFKVPVLYGGSVAGANIGAILKEGEIEGVLVGHQSLMPSQMNEMIKVMNNV